MGTVGFEPTTRALDFEVWLQIATNQGERYETFHMSAALPTELSPQFFLFLYNLKVLVKKSTTLSTNKPT